MSSNQPWTKEETILALELYARLRHEPKQISENNPQIVALSKYLRALPIHPGIASTKLRTPDGVVLKLFNFLYLDPDAPSRGLSEGAHRIAKEVWNEFAMKRESLTQAAAVIRRKYRAGSP